MITAKYNYKKLERIDSPDGRQYVVRDGVSLPSVTTILSKTKDMTGLDEWRRAVGDAKADQIVTEAGFLGTAMHNNLENYIAGKEMSGSFMAKALAKLIIKEAFPRITEIWGSEVMLYTEGLYAGTTDLVGLHENVPAIMDYKNSRSAKEKEWIEDYFMQLAAYSLSHNEMYGTDIRKGVVMVATRDARYQEFIIEGDEFIKYQVMWLEKVDVYYSLPEISINTP